MGNPGLIAGNFRARHSPVDERGKERNTERVFVNPARANWRSGCRRESDRCGRILQTAEEHGGSAQLFIAEKNGSSSEGGSRPNQRSVDLDDGKRSVAAQKKAVVDQLTSGIGSADVVDGEGALPKVHQQRG